MDAIALAEVLVRDLLALGHDKLVAILVDEQSLTLPHLIDFGRDQLSHTLYEGLVEVLLLQIQDLAREGLA